MTNDRFFRGFLAALSLRGQKFIDTRDDAHHERFSRVVDRLKGVGEARTSEADLPLTFISSPFTGRFREYDDALLQLQRGGLLGAQNPYYPGINLDIEEEYAKRILAEFPDNQRRILSDLAETYLAPITSPAGSGGDAER